MTPHSEALFLTIVPKWKKREKVLWECEDFRKISDEGAGAGGVGAQTIGMQQLVGSGAKGPLISSPSAGVLVGTKAGIDLLTKG